MSENKITVESHVFSDGKIGITFISNGGKFGTDELLDEFELSAEQLLNILQANEDNTSDKTALNIDLVSKRFEIGDKVMITRCVYGHEFDVSDVVIVESDSGDNSDEVPYYCRKGNQTWYISKDEANVC
mgnify:CR=1 FL=1|jgi:hypothetical protein